MHHAKFASTLTDYYREDVQEKIGDYGEGPITRFSQTFILMGSTT